MLSNLSTPVKAGAGVAALIVLAVVVYLVRPLFFDTVVDEEFPMAAGAVVPDGMTIADVEAEMLAAAEGPDAAVGDEMPATGFTVLSMGEFVGADDFHEGMGTATVFTLEDGSNVLRFEDFRVTNGPDLHVYLAPLDQFGIAQINDEAAVDLGSLKGNVGNQNYEVPDSIDLTQPYAVVIWCDPFRVTFATAALT